MKPHCSGGPGRYLWPMLKDYSITGKTASSLSR